MRNGGGECVLPAALTPHYKVTSGQNKPGRAKTGIDLLEVQWKRLTQILHASVPATVVIALELSQLIVFGILLALSLEAVQQRDDFFVGQESLQQNGHRSLDELNVLVFLALAQVARALLQHLRRVQHFVDDLILEFYLLCFFVAFVHK